jgi:ADP-ribosylglycohydrolase
MIRQRIENALWGAFIGDALAMPVHWFYSRERVREQFPEGIDGYKAPPHPHPDAFMLGMSYAPDVEMAKSLGRPFDILHEHARFYRTPYSRFAFDLSQREGEHGNLTASTDQRMHYHHGLEAGESTLGASLLRVMMRSVIDRGGYSERGFLEDFIAYMTRPRDNPDPYTESYLRRWFESFSRGVAAENCADFQRRNWSVGSLGGVIRPLALSLLNWDNSLLSPGMALSHHQLTHRSELVSGAISLLTPALRTCLGSDTALPVFDTLAHTLHVPATSGAELFRHYREHEGPGNIPDDTMWALHMTFSESTVAEVDQEHLGTPCYIEQGLPLMISLARQHAAGFFDTLRANAEAGGDCVHRGMVLGLLLGASTQTIPEPLRTGLKDHVPLAEEISAFAEIAQTGNGHLIR